MIMKKIVLSIFGIILIILELSVFNKFSIMGVNLNLLLIYCIILATNVDGRTHYICVALVGSIYDILISPIFALNMIWMLLMSALTRFIMDRLYEDRIWSLVIILLLTTSLTVLYSFSLDWLFFVPYRISFLVDVIGKSVLVNTIAGLFLWILSRPLLQHIMKNWW